MSRFYVGQRVRIVGPCGDGEFAPYLGRVGRIVAPWNYGLVQRLRLFFFHGKAWEPIAGTYWILDCGGKNSDGYDYGWHECDLAPAYDGHEKVSWSECAWQPTPERVA